MLVMHSFIHILELMNMNVLLHSHPQSYTTYLVSACLFFVVVFVRDRDLQSHTM